MDISALKINTVKAKLEIDVLMETIKNGKAILFTGAGFSFGSTNVTGKEPLGAKKLSNKLADILEISVSDNLMFTSDYFLSKKPARELIGILKDNYILKTTSNDQNTICSLPWRRFYTTNYDLSIEIASQQSERLVETVDLSHSYAELYQRKVPLCVHLNGSINSLNEESLNDSFKLSASSYISPESFLTSDWYYCFKKDLERASAIVFVGYSLYDIDIQRVLFKDESLSDKTYFITVEKPDVELEFTLSKFGRVLTIGTNGFSGLITDYKSDENEPNLGYSMQSLSLYELSDHSVEIRDNNVENLLMYGDVEDSVIDSFVLDDIKIPFLIDRPYLDSVLRSINNNRHVIFYGALGNGKSLLLKELRSSLSVQNMNVYNVDDLEGDYIGDIDHLSTFASHSIIILDDYEKYLLIIEHISRSKVENLTIVASARIADHEYHREKLIENGLIFDEYNIDRLFETEVVDLINIFENLGYWTGRGVSEAQRKRYIIAKNESQIALALLDFLDSPVIKDKLNGLISKLKSNGDFENTLLAICLCQIIGVPPTKSLISELAGNDSIYSPSLQGLKEFRQLFRMKNGEVTNSSSILCICLIQEHFSAPKVTAQLLHIASKFNEIITRDGIQDRVFKSMLKFSFVERILPKTTKVGNLQRYYEDLKINIPWLRSNPHFWLQYAMSFIAFKQYPKAQSLLEQAYDLAYAKKDYYTDNIDTQQARLWLLECNAITDGNRVFDNFQKANSLLRKRNNDIYKFRQIARYKEFHSENFSKLSKKNKQLFVNLCKEIIILIEKLESEESSNLQYLQRAKNNLISVTEA
jgi:hypothetical protein